MSFNALSAHQVIGGGGKSKLSFDLINRVNTVLVAGKNYLVDSTMTPGVTLQVTLPSAPAPNVQVRLVDYLGLFDVWNVNVISLDHPIRAVNGTYVLNQKNSSRTFLYLSSDYGWLVLQ